MGSPAGTFPRHCLLVVALPPATLRLIHTVKPADREKEDRPLWPIASYVKMI
jgi:hypothetical protein